MTTRVGADAAAAMSNAMRAAKPPVPDRRMSLHASCQRPRRGSLSQQSSRRADSLCFMMRWLGVRSNSSTTAM